jgi:DNA-binding XRE family transcriptional regulator
VDEILESDVTAVLVNKQLVKELRIKRSYTQEKLAAMVGVNLRTIQRIETNGVASLDTRGALAKALDVRPEDLDVPETAAPANQGVPRPHWLLLLISVALVVIGATTLAVAINTITPIGLVTLPAVVGLSATLTGFFILSRLTPLSRWRIYAVLCIVAVSLLASPPAWTIRGLVVISLWGALELGILLTRFRLRQSHA